VSGYGTVSMRTTPKNLGGPKPKGFPTQPCKPADHGKKAEIKPEVFTMLEDGPAFRRLLILSDGMCDGGAMLFKIRKQGKQVAVVTGKRDRLAGQR
jgi:hypothetical protein